MEHSETGVDLPIGIEPTVHFAFKRIFGSSDSHEITIHFLIPSSTGKSIPFSSSARIDHALAHFRPKVVNGKTESNQSNRFGQERSVKRRTVKLRSADWTEVCPIWHDSPHWPHDGDGAGTMVSSAGMESSFAVVSNGAQTSGRHGLDSTW